MYSGLASDIALCLLLGLTPQPSRIMRRICLAEFIKFNDSGSLLFEFINPPSLRLRKGDGTYNFLGSRSLGVVGSTRYASSKNKLDYCLLNIPLPIYWAFSPNSSSILRSSLYFPTLSVRESEPVFICPDDNATDKCEIVTSSVSPDL